MVTPFKSKQKVFRIGKVSIGGQLGEYPTVLIGTIFYKGHKVVLDEKTGKIDEKAAEDLLAKQDELANDTGCPCMVDIVGMTPEAIRRFIDFVAKCTDAPLLIDAVSADVRIEALKYCKEVGLSDRAVYNSIMPSPWYKQEEVDALKESGVTASIVLAYNLKDRSSRGVISILKGVDGEKGLLDIAKEAGVDKILVDTTLFTYVPSVGIGGWAIRLVKEEFGLPAGGAPGNATSVWKSDEIWKRWGEDVWRACDAVAQTLTSAYGADFIMYGPIEFAPHIFPACATVDAAVAAEMKEAHGISPATKDHPLYKLFAKFAEKLGL
jgi:tetrahydromethanopterin S-methyltransferase subunit H